MYLFTFALLHSGRTYAGYTGKEWPKWMRVWVVGGEEGMVEHISVKT
jgi:hypothetical protein